MTGADDMMRRGPSNTPGLPPGTASWCCMAGTAAFYLPRHWRSFWFAAESGRSCLRSRRTGRGMVFGCPGEWLA